MVMVMAGKTGVGGEPGYPLRSLMPAGNLDWNPLSGYFPHTKASAPLLRGYPDPIKPTCRPGEPPSYSPIDEGAGAAAAAFFRTPGRWDSNETSYAYSPKNGRFANLTNRGIAIWLFEGEMMGKNTE